jgi:subtilase family serine protease
MKPLRKQIAAVAATLLIVLPAALAQTAIQTELVQPRILGSIDSASRTTLAGSHPPIARAANDAGAVENSMALHGISLVLSRTPQQEAALQTLIAAQQNVASPLYHQWLTPDQFAAEFGVADSDIAAAEAWLQQQGFAIDSVARSRNRIMFSGTAAQVASAFGAPIHNFKSADGSVHFAPSTDLTLPTALSSIVLAVENLSSFKPHPQIILPPRQPTAQATAQFTSSQTGNHFIGPGDISTIYDVKPVYQAGYTGVNQSIAVIGQSFVYLSDIANFQSAAGITGKTPILVLMPNTGYATPYSDDLAESDLDLEYASTMAPGAQVYLVYTGNSSNYGAFNAIQYAVDERIAPIISSSYGACEVAEGASGIAALDAVLAQAATQGQTVLSAAGDFGSSGCYGDYTSTDIADNTQLSVNYPASSVYVTGMGGTEIPTADAAATNTTYWTAASTTTGDIIASAKSYIPEQAWNDSAANSTPDGGGGGVSIYEPRPTWQTGVTVGGVAIPTGSFRLVPDISLVASNANAPLIFCTSDTTAWVSGQKNSCNAGFRDSSSQDLTLAGGTSFDAPIFSGMLALINQALNSTGQGLINPTLYSLASNTTTYASAFHDITLAGNQCLAGTAVCGAGLDTTDYAAATGYDEATGLGSIDLNNLLTAWPKAAAASLAETTTTVTAATTTPASSAADAVTITVAPVSGSVVPTGTVAVTVDGISAGSLTLSSGKATYSFASSVSGSHVIVATYAGTTTLGASTGSLALSVGTIVPTGSFTLTPNPASFTVTAGSSASFTLTAAPSAGYTGTIQLGFGTTSTTLNNFCFSDTNGGLITISGTTSASDTITLYTSSTTCNKLGLTIYNTHTSSSPQFRFTQLNGKLTSGVAALQPLPIQPQSQGTPLRRAALPAALACLLLTFGLGRRSRLGRGKLARAALSLAAVALLSLAGFGLTACSSSAAPSAVAISSSNTTAGTYVFQLTGYDTVNPTIAAQTTVTMTVQ